MLAKCANPICNTRFQRLNEGKLFLVRSAPDHAPELTARRRIEPRRVEYYWLCGPCAALLTLAFNSKTGITTVPLPQSFRPSEPKPPASAHAGADSQCAALSCITGPNP